MLMRLFIGPTRQKELESLLFPVAIFFPNKETKYQHRAQGQYPWTPFFVLRVQIRVPKNQSFKLDTRPTRGPGLSP
jgi:hypothetical protein